MVDTMANQRIMGICGLVVQLVLLLWLTKELAAVAASSLAKPNCNDTCGDIKIPFPFGIGKECSINEYFAVNCNHSDNSSNSWKPILRSVKTELELLGISLQGVARVKSPVFSLKNCSDNGLGEFLTIDLSGSPFYFSEIYNRFTAIACQALAYMQLNDEYIGGCFTVCDTDNRTLFDGCYGRNCCQTAIPPALDHFNISIELADPPENSERCDKQAFMMEHSTEKEQVPEEGELSKESSVLKWGQPVGICKLKKSSTNFCSENGYCWTKLSAIHLCVCGAALDDPDISYVSSGCQDVDKSCGKQYKNSCTLLCLNSPKNKNCSSCPDGYVELKASRGYLPQKGSLACLMVLDEPPRKKAHVIVLGCSAGIGMIILVLAILLLYKVIQRRKKMLLKQKFFKKNGGLLLQQQFSSKGSIEKTKLFPSVELEKATDHYNENRILGQGGQGTVYKGMLVDGTVVAIKRSKQVDKDKIERFINEVVILSHINHRNVVKLLGCCLETEVPLLVYELVSNGTLFELLHDQKEDFPITWELRLRIAEEVADALSYLHSAASLPIYHRDVKSTNILLDKNYRAKLSDFGISKTIDIDQTHVTTHVQGTFGYLDPEYFRSNQFTEKSDVYSFGVVLVELLTGQKPVSTTESLHKRSLVMYFLLAMEENRLFEILDARVKNEGEEDKIEAVAKLAKRCLNLNGIKRPTMKEVAMELEEIREPYKKVSASQQSYEEVDSDEEDIIRPVDIASSSTASCLDTTTLSSNFETLFSNTS